MNAFIFVEKLCLKIRVFGGSKIQTHEYEGVHVYLVGRLLFIVLHKKIPLNWRDFLCNNFKIIFIF